MRKIGTASAVILMLALLLTSSGVRATPLNGTVNGRVTDSGGTGIANVSVFINNLILTTNGSGYYAGSVPAGTNLNMVAYAPVGGSYANAHQYSMVVPEGGTLTKDWTLSSSVGTMTGYVYDVNTQARISGVVLLLDSDIHDGWSNTMQPTGSNGVFSMDRIAAGRTYYLHAFPPSPYIGVAIAIGTVNPGSNTYNVPLGTANTGIRGHVSLPGGGNAVGAGVLIGDASGSGTTCTTNTDSSGNYSCSLPPGSYVAHVLEFDGYPGLIDTDVQLSSGYLTLNFAYNNGPATISGQARDFNLNPINGANVQAFEHIAPFGHFRSVFVGSDGAYNFTGMGNQGSYLLSGAAVGYATITDDNVPIPGNNSLSFNFKLGHFPDVQAQDPNSMVEFPFYYIEYLKAAGVVSGYPNGTYLPNSNVKRGEYTKLLVAAAGWTIDTSGGPHFSDVATNYAFYGYIETAYHHGAISGYPDGTFRPNTTVSRAEATKISVAVSGWPLLNPPTADYTDVPTSHWAYQFIETALSHGANANDGGGYFRPNAAATRAETAKLICVANATGCQ